MVCALVFP